MVKGAPFVRRRASALADLILARIEGVANEIAMAGFDGAELQRIVGVIRGRAQRLLDLGLESRGGAVTD